MLEVAPGILRVTADNPSMMTYHGTNTYLIESQGRYYVLDPGPASDQLHLDWLVEFLKGRAAGIILTHHHSDHFGLAPQLRAQLEVPVFAYAVFADDTFKPDVELDNGDTFAGLEVLHTPGHASDHICVARNDGVLFTGDHVMGWNSSIVMLPDGDMAEYCTQLRRLLERTDSLYLPGHGPAVADPLPYTRRLLDHRVRREREIIAALAERPQSEDELAPRLYRKSDPWLAKAALRNLQAHLDKLLREGVVLRDAAGYWELTQRA
jgi:glyoxylase-like metal-dependent hydrolase (beta-lactamase superfamily II)